MDHFKYLNKHNSKGLNDITLERIKSFNKGKTPEYDSNVNNRFQLTKIAELLLYNANDDIQDIYLILDNYFHPSDDTFIEWDKDYVKSLLNKPYEYRVRIAGGLLVSELDKIEYNRRFNEQYNGIQSGQ